MCVWKFFIGLNSYLMEINLFMAIFSIVGFSVVVIVYTAFFSLFALLLYSYIRAVCRYIFRMDNLIDAKTEGLSFIDKFHFVETYSIIILCAILAIYIGWTWKWFSEGFGILITVTCPFFLLFFLPKNNMQLFVKISLSILLLAALLHLSEDDYSIIKSYAVFCFLLLTYYRYNEDKKIEMLIYFSLMLLFQPFIYIHLNNIYWNIIDVIVSLGLILSLFKKQLSALNNSRKK